MQMDNDLKELLSALNAHDVKYLVVRGYAVGVYAEPRATKDLDIWIKADSQNSQAVYRALSAYGAPLSGLTPLDFSNDPSPRFPPATPRSCEHPVTRNLPVSPTSASFPHLAPPFASGSAASPVKKRNKATHTSSNAPTYPSSYLQIHPVF